MRTIEPQSGYTPCACRDCMDVAITSDGKPALCLLCKDAGCEISYGEFMGASGAHSLECQRADAYDQDA
jgi:molybdenum cofactor biosynthesis enzyme MoaA